MCVLALFLRESSQKYFLRRPLPTKSHVSISNSKSAPPSSTPANKNSNDDDDEYDEDDDDNEYSNDFEDSQLSTSRGGRGRGRGKATLPTTGSKQQQQGAEDSYGGDEFEEDETSLSVSYRAGSSTATSAKQKQQEHGQTNTGHSFQGGVSRAANRYGANATTTASTEAPVVGVGKVWGHHTGGGGGSRRQSFEGEQQPEQRPWVDMGYSGVASTAAQMGTGFGGGRSDMSGGAGVADSRMYNGDYYGGQGGASLHVPLATIDISNSLRTSQVQCGDGLSRILYHMRRLVIMTNS